MELDSRKTIWARDVYIFEGKFQSDGNQLENQNLVISNEQPAEITDQPAEISEQPVQEGTEITTDPN